MTKRKRINLFSKGVQHKFFEVERKIVLYSTVTGAFLFVVFLIFIILGFTQKDTLSKLNNEKEEMLRYMVENKNSETETAYFLLKKDQLKKFLKDDAQFLPYYNILSDSIREASDQAHVQSMLIDKDKKTNFVINFTEYNALYSYLKYVESDDFLRHFEKLTLTSFSLDQTEDEANKEYELNFEGVFKIKTEKGS